jgi:hypothetical protein
MVTEHPWSHLARCARRRALATLTLLVAGITALVGVPALALAGPAPFAFADNNNNGVFDPGIDTDISQALKNGGLVATAESLVLPDKMKSVTTKNPLGLTLHAGKNITLGGYVNAAAPVAGITVIAETGDITMLRSARLRANQFVCMFAADDITLGAKVNIAVYRRGSVISMNAGGDILLPDMRLRATDAIDLTAIGDVLIGSTAHFYVPNGTVRFSSRSDVVGNCSGS